MSLIVPMDLCLLMGLMDSEDLMDLCHHMDQWDLIMDLEDLMDLSHPTDHLDHIMDLNLMDLEDLMDLFHHTDHLEDLMDLCHLMVHTILKKEKNQ